MITGEGAWWPAGHQVVRVLERRQLWGHEVCDVLLDSSGVVRRLPARELAPLDRHSWTGDEVIWRAAACRALQLAAAGEPRGDHRRRCRAAAAPGGHGSARARHGSRAAGHLRRGRPRQNDHGGGDRQRAQGAPAPATRARRSAEGRPAAVGCRDARPLRRGVRPCGPRRTSRGRRHRSLASVRSGRVLPGCGQAAAPPRAAGAPTTSSSTTAAAPRRSYVRAGTSWSSTRPTTWPARAKTSPATGSHANSPRRRRTCCSSPPRPIQGSPTDFDASLASWMPVSSTARR